MFRTIQDFKSFIFPNWKPDLSNLAALLQVLHKWWALGTHWPLWSPLCTFFCPTNFHANLPIFVLFCLLKCYVWQHFFWAVFLVLQDPVFGYLTSDHLVETVPSVNLSTGLKLWDTEIFPGRTEQWRWIVEKWGEQRSYLFILSLFCYFVVV